MNLDEIWRIRATSTSDEPPAAVVIDYGFDRVYLNQTQVQETREAISEALVK